MNLNTVASKKSAIWGIAIVFIISIYLRFWELGKFNQLIFDEVYYAKFANNYLTNTKFYNSHPPLSQYLIAIGIWIGDSLPIGRDIVNTLTGSLRSTFSYRWMNAAFGSLIPLLVAALAYQLTQRLSYAFLCALFVSLDGLFLVDSRYALNNIFLIFFGLLGQLFVVMAGKARVDKQTLLMILAGVSFGAAAACKWNGLWFLLGTYILLAIAQIIRLIELDNYTEDVSTSPIDILAAIHPIKSVITLTIIPIFTYSLLWIPHLIQNPELDFWEMQLSILNYHERVKNGIDIHPYCANWYTWPLLLRPLAYYFEKDEVTQIYHDVHAMGNPLLWWYSLIAIFGLIGFISKCLIVAPLKELNISAMGIPIYLVVNYAANLLPWVKVSRCLFIYHYMGAVLFAMMGLAWVVDGWLRSSSKLFQGIGLTVIFSIAGAFVFWLPIYLGLPLDQVGLSWRIWNYSIFNWI